MKILWHSNAPWVPSGYGTQTAVWVEQMVQAGHDVRISAFAGITGAFLKWGANGRAIPVLPCNDGGDKYGANALANHAQAFDPDVVVTLIDPWVLSREIMEPLPWAAWSPVDHEPLSPAMADVLASAVWPIAMSRHGERMMRDAGLDPLYVPHGINTKLFAPVDDRAAVRKKLFDDINRVQGDGTVNDETFLAVMVAANQGMPSRKSFTETLLAWDAFSREVENCHLYLHTEAQGLKGGVNLVEAATRIVKRQDTLTFCDQYGYVYGLIGADQVAALYNAADVLVNPAMGEGFGLPIVEAQASGCPVIVGDNSAQTELCFSGKAVGGKSIWTPLGAWQVSPDVGELTRALLWAHDERRNPAVREKARAGALAYSIDAVWEQYWQPALEAMVL